MKTKSRIYSLSIISVLFVLFSGCASTPRTTSTYSTYTSVDIRETYKDLLKKGLVDEAESLWKEFGEDIIKFSKSILQVAAVRDLMASEDLEKLDVVAEKLGWDKKILLEELKKFVGDNIFLLFLHNDQTYIESSLKICTKYELDFGKIKRQEIIGAIALAKFENLEIIKDSFTQEELEEGVRLSFEAFHQNPEGIEDRIKSLNIKFSRRDRRFQEVIFIGLRKEYERFIGILSKPSDSLSFREAHRKDKRIMKIYKKVIGKELKPYQLNSSFYLTVANIKKYTEFFEWDVDNPEFMKILTFAKEINWEDLGFSG